MTKLLVGTVIIILAYIVAGETSIIVAQSDANKAMPTTLMCFDGAGQPSHGQFAECHRVAYKRARV